MSKILEQAPFKWLITGESKSGKTFAFADFLTKKHLGANFFSHIILISPSALSDESWQRVKQFYKERFKIYTKYTEDLFSKCIADLSTLEGEKLIIVDDCEGVLSKGWNANSGVVQAFNGIVRKGYISIVVINQNWTSGCNPALKNQADINSAFILGGPKQYANFVDSLGASNPERTVKTFLEVLKEPFAFCTFVKGTGYKHIYYKFSHFIEEY